METVWTIVLIITLLVVVYQDLRFRAVSWLVFPVLALAGSGLYWHDPGWLLLLQYSTANWLFMAIQLAGIFIYLSAKHRKATDITRNYLGWGDILFLMILALFFSPMNFIAFYMISLLAVLLGTAVYRVVVSTTCTIPLAGWQAALLLLVMGSSRLFSFSLHEETWITYLMITHE